MLFLWVETIFASVKSVKSWTRTAYYLKNSSRSHVITESINIGYFFLYWFSNIQINRLIYLSSVFQISGKENKIFSRSKNFCQSHRFYTRNPWNRQKVGYIIHLKIHIKIRVNTTDRNYNRMRAFDFSGKENYAWIPWFVLWDLMLYDCAVIWHEI